MASRWIYIEGLDIPGGVVSKKLLRKPGLELWSSCLLTTAAGDANHCAIELTKRVKYTLLYIIKLLFALYVKHFVNAMTNARLLFARLSVSVAVLSSVFIIAVVSVPKYFHTADASSFDYYDYYAEDDNSTKLISVTCSDKFEGYCLNGGLCIYLEEEFTAACICTGGYGGKRCEKYLWYH